MPTFKNIDHITNLNNYDKWEDSTKFNSKDQIVNKNGKIADESYKGHKFRLIIKKEYKFSSLERVGRGFLGVVAVICFLGLPLFSKTIRNFFTKEKVTIRFGVEVHCYDPEKTSEHTVDPLENKSAIDIQKHFRAFQAKRPLLSPELYDQYQTECKKAEGPEADSIPQALDGNTTVYLPKEMPEVVLKKAGKKQAIRRFHQMQQARTVLDAQKSSHLIIPKASLCQEYLVEERLPINGNAYHNMEVYLSQPHAFDEAVREFTRLFSQIYLSDLISDYRSPYFLERIKGVGDSVRYDNLPLYIVEENGKQVGKIGLIDLEHLENKPNSKCLEILARIFPFHLNIIKEEAEKLDMQIDEEALEAAATKGEKYLKVGFTDHVNYLNKKGISADNPNFEFELTPERIEQITSIVEKELLKLNEGVNETFFRHRYTDEPPKNFLLGKSDKTAKELAKEVTPLILKNIETQIQAQQNLQKPQPPLITRIAQIFTSCVNKFIFSTSSHLEESIVMTQSELVHFRSTRIDASNFRLGVEDLMRKNKKINFENRHWNDIEDTAEQLSCAVLEELVKGGELFYIDLHSKIWWLRY